MAGVMAASWDVDEALTDWVNATFDAEGRRMSAREIEDARRVLEQAHADGKEPLG